MPSHHMDCNANCMRITSRNWCKSQSECYRFECHIQHPGAKQTSVLHPAGYRRYCTNPRRYRRYSHHLYWHQLWNHLLDNHHQHQQRCLYRRHVDIQHRSTSHHACWKWKQSSGGDQRGWAGFDQCSYFFIQISKHHKRNSSISWGYNDYSRSRFCYFQYIHYRCERPKYQL